MDQVRSRPDLCGAFCMNGDKERAQPSRPQQFSFGPLFAPVSASWLGSLAALSAATRTRAPKRATGIQKPSHRGPAFGEARFSLTQQSTGLLLPVSTPRWGVRKPEFVSSHLIPFAPQKTRPPIGWSCFLWSGRRGSNSLPRPWQGRALPDELRPQTAPLLQHRWCLRPGSNRRHADFQSAALPTELPRQIGDQEGARTLDLQRDRLAF